jgi:medium-chain acyl-[acyl-carrier-protein] hydrolase
METTRETTRLTFGVHSFDADAFGHLAPAALAGYLQEAAGRSADGLGFGLAALRERGLTWVLARTRLVLDAPLRWGDALTVETWPSGLDRLAALRDFRLWRDGQEVGRALTTWFALDLATRKPVRPQSLLPEARHAQTEHVLPPAEPPIPDLVTATIDLRFQVRFADIDANLHVTNASYVAWLTEAQDEAGWRERRLAALDVQFLAEGHLGGYVRSRSGPDGEPAGAATGGPQAATVLRHLVVREEDQKPLARARTTWVAR